MTQPRGYVDSEYLRIAGESVLHLKRRTYELMHIQRGHKVLDVGCGPASDTIELGRCSAWIMTRR
jgi:ubiquinone/menaquinone biosynthesis C-methylase UbiE